MSVTLNDITKYIKFNNTNIKFTLNTSAEFEQSFDIPIKVVDPNSCYNVEVNIENEEGNSNNILQYKYDDIINLPNTLCDLLDLNNYYSYGVNEEHIFVYSLLYVYDKNFKLLSEKDKEDVFQSFKQELLDKLNDSTGNGYWVKGVGKVTAKGKNKLNTEINSNNFKSLTLEIFGSIALITFSFIKDITNTVREAKIEDKEEYLNIRVVLIQVNIKSNVKP